jgi:predicted small lipoprotein YifL
MRARPLAALCALAFLLCLAGCGKKSAPQAPGPRDKIIYPMTYPPY